MLQPIKTFFHYLQKNANSSGIFRSSNDLNMTDEPNTSEGGIFDDPLTDPLAIDDEFNSSNTDVLENDQEPSEISVDKFIFVDIEKLKSKPSEKAKTDKKKVNASDINGNSDHSTNCHEKVESEKIIDKVETAKLIATEELDAKKCNANEQENGDKKNSFALSIASSEVDTDEVDASVLLEEVRSDGSDSGYAGSDSVRTISELEKNLASQTPGKSSLKRKSMDQSLHEEQPKKIKQGINFGNVTVFYFPRCQGFGCVPTQGGSTLGMSSKHAYKKTFTLIEHANEQRRLNRLKLARSELNTSSSSSDESKSEDELVESLSEADNEVYGFLQPVTARQRRAILKGAGVRKIDVNEKDECRQLRTSREVCGCACRSYCDPDTCECSLAGIKCQVDRLKPQEFPCGCNRDGCGNVNGRIEFNPSRVKTHFIHTIMRLELEKRQELSEDNGSSSAQHASTKWWSQMRSSTHGVLPNTNSNNGSYSTYIYGNGSPQYATKIPSISTVVNSEALDLHYAYREEYPNPISLSTDVGSNSFNCSNDYYSNYNYMSVPMGSSGVFHSNYQSTTPYQQQNYNSDCQYSNYTVTNGSSNYRIETMNEINSYNYSQMQNGVATPSRNNYQSIQPTQSQQTTSSQEIVLHNLNPSNQNDMSSIVISSVSNDRKEDNENLKKSNDSVPAQ